jgi:hypothetical protein
MCLADVSHEQWLSRLVDHLQKERYRPKVVRRWASGARRFLAYLRRRGTHVEEVQASDIAGFLQGERQRYHRRHHHRPASLAGWRNSQTGGVHMLLRLALGQWPPLLVPSTTRDRFQATPDARVRDVDAGPSRACSGDACEPMC